MIKSAGKNSWEHRALWTGTRWINSWAEEADYDKAEEVKIKEWRGIAYDPDELEIREELDRLVVEFNELSKEEN